MTQSRTDSLRETLAHTLARFVVSALATAYVLPLVGVDLPLTQNLTARAAMTAIHAAPTYAIRRAFNARVGRSAL
ncbi:hypothetical protein [Methylocystis sp. SC2]|uniref:DUF7220 family protein n=1 Tax=Methylocystis sp. (strain SC2) TaxID=187303 RepID=UPI00027AF028|nr:hypothetical protein [Methylocystis sp. SC2]CCJ07080.1 Hypothetical protein BN69_1629 [Methylocystis sp. SC2]